MHTPNGIPGHPDAGVRTLDTAKGIVVGLRRCGIDQAFNALVNYARQHQVGAICLADALIAIAQGAPTHYLDGHAVAAARAMWADLHATALIGEGISTPTP